jgi:tripartite-type tricarboxylate transporter receptor subunit TctC
MRPFFLNRRRFTAAVLGVGNGLRFSHSQAQSLAQSFASRPIRVVIPFAPGGGTDVIGRPLLSAMGQDLGQTLYIDNKPGGGTVIGSDVVAKSAPDGHTILMTTSSVAINAGLLAQLPYDTLADLPPVGRICQGPNVIVVRADSPFKTLRDLITYAKQHPGKLSYASSGNGSAVHLAAELFKSMTDTRILHIPYRGAGPAYTDLLGGQVDLLVGTAGGAHKFVQSGRMRALAVTSTSRVNAYRDVPTVAEFVPGYSAEVWYGVFASKGTPTAILDRLNVALRKAVGTPGYADNLSREGLSVAVNSPAEMAAFMREEVARWRKVVVTGNIKPD